MAQHDIELRDKDMEIWIDFATPVDVLSMRHPELAKLEDLLRAWFEVVPIALFKFFEKPSAPGIWNYQFDHDDGREWRQEFDFVTAPITEPLRSTTNTDPWRRSEYQPHLTVREQIILLHTMLHMVYLKVERM